MRKKVSFGLAVLFTLSGFWVGEGGSAPWNAPALASVFGAALALAVVVPGKFWVKSVAACASFFFYFSGLQLGSSSFTQAFNECVENGEEVRTQIRRYHESESQFPERLRQLAGSRVCGRIIRGTLLEYERTNTGYVLSFKDGLVEHRATESEPFMAYK